MNMNARKYRPNITIKVLMFLVIYAIDDEKQGGVTRMKNSMP